MEKKESIQAFERVFGAKAEDLFTAVDGFIRRVGAAYADTIGYRQAFMKLLSKTVSP